MSARSAAYQEVPATSGSLLIINKYLTSQKIRDGLALFAVLVIARFLLQRMRGTWISIRRRATSSRSRFPASVGLQPPPPPPLPPPAFYARPDFAFAHSGRAFFHAMGRNRDTTSSGGSSHRSLHPSDDKIMLPMGSQWQSGAKDVRGQFVSRMPPAAPPLAPPNALSSSAASPHASNQPYAISIDRFIHQPNPDYMSSTASAMPQPDSTATPGTMRRWSYHRTLPVGVAPTTPRSFNVDVHSATAQALSAPSSSAPNSPLLPAPPPPDATDGHQTQVRLMDVEGEIVSKLNQDGTGWTRHTRVYGGGGCF
ncbi:hypothetical protein E4U55_006405 [Claviceps digitariae]|nr:hypothetical protein E4U55_006405 [Claviceps digitariae]